MARAGVALKRYGRTAPLAPAAERPRKDRAGIGLPALVRAWPGAAGRRIKSEWAASRRKIRVGLFADSALQPRWVVEAFAKVAASEVAEIIALAVGEARPRAQHWLWRAYGRIDRRLFGSGPDPSERVSLRERFAHVCVFGMPDRDSGQPAITRWREALKRLRLDVAFALGDIDDAAVAGVARYGVWRYCFGAQRHAVESLAGVCEATDAAPVTLSALKARRELADERLVYQSWSRTYPFSVARNRENVLRKSAEFAVRALKRLHVSGERWIEQCTPLGEAVPVIAPERFSTAESVRGLSRLGTRIVRRALQKLLFVDQWFLGYRFRGEGCRQNDLQSFARLMPPKDRLWADPFPLERDGRYFVFFEQFVFAEGRGHIAMVEIRRDGSCSAPLRVLERDYHLSYPFLIDCGGQLYMVPESLENRTVELYRCVEFPARWRLERVLIRDALCADATFHQGSGKWWMFVNVGLEGTEAHDELHVFFADSLHGDWRPHRSNPVKSDVRSARPAGQLFLRGGVLYRPAQICAPLYGSGLSINRVLHLSPQAYLEREEERILPAQDTGILGIHTLNCAGELSVMDGFVRRSRMI